MPSSGRDARKMDSTTKSILLILFDIEYAFKEEEKKEFAPIEIDMKEQTMSQSETENNSQSDDD